MVFANESQTRKNRLQRAMAPDLPQWPQLLRAMGRLWTVGDRRLGICVWKQAALQLTKWRSRPRYFSCSPRLLGHQVRTKSSLALRGSESGAIRAVEKIRSADGRRLESRSRSSATPARTASQIARRTIFQETGQSVVILHCRVTHRRKAFPLCACRCRFARLASAHQTTFLQPLARSAVSQPAPLDAFLLHLNLADRRDARRSGSGGGDGGLCGA